MIFKAIPIAIALYTQYALGANLPYAPLLVFLSGATWIYIYIVKKDTQSVILQASLVLLFYIGLLI